MFTADTSLCCFTLEVSRCVHVCISTLDHRPQNSSKISADRNVQHLHSFPSCFLSLVSLCFVFCPPNCSFHLVNSTPFRLIFSHLILITPPLHFIFSLSSFSFLLLPSLPLLLLLLFPTSLFCCLLPSFVCFLSFLIPSTSNPPLLSSYILLPFLLSFLPRPFATSLSCASFHSFSSSLFCLFYSRLIFFAASPSK